MNPCEPPYEIKPIREINPSLSGGLERIILKCTQRDPNDRYQSAAELMYALEHYEEIDDLYRKKQKSKLFKFVASVAMTCVFAGVSAFSFFAAENKKGENYDYILANASQYTDYYEAIVTSPTKVDAYLGNGDYKGLIDFLISDGELTSDENSVFVKLKGGLEEIDMWGYSSTVNVLDELKNADMDGYQEICYRIGEAYLFYYNISVEKDKYATAATWFQYASDKYPVAKVYCDISTCLQNITKFSKAEQYANLYQEYQGLWSRIQSLKNDAVEYDDDLKLRVWGEIVNMVRNNAKEFCEVASQEEILSLLDSIGTQSKDVNNTFLQSSISSLIDKIETTKIKIQSVKINGTTD